MNSPTEAAGDSLAAYLDTIPRGLNANQWGRWRAKNRPPYFQPENRRGNRCGLCGGELGVLLQLCTSCMEREFAYVRELEPPDKPPPQVPDSEGRTLREELVAYPEQGRHRPAMQETWYVVDDAQGFEVTRSLKREVAESYL